MLLEKDLFKILHGIFDNIVVYRYKNSPKDSVCTSGETYCYYCNVYDRLDEYLYLFMTRSQPYTKEIGLTVRISPTTNLLFSRKLWRVFLMNIKEEAKLLSKTT